MLKSLYSGVSGMKGFQTKLDVIGNNIANVNTIGFKKSRVMFQDIINQNISGATAPSAQQGGINPKQIGLGTKIASIDTIHTPGSPMTTNVGTDLAIDGDAFFVVTPEKGAKNYLTRAGNFTRDANGYLVNSNGLFASGVIMTGSPATPRQELIKIMKDEVFTPPVGEEKKADFVSYSIDANGYINVVRGDGETGQLAYDTTTNKYYLNKTLNADQNISLSTAVVSNPSGLSKVGNSLFEETGNSGKVTVTRIEENNGGQIASGILEMSNVDLTEEFTELIVAQRGFQANARTITTSDSILEEVVNLKR